MTDSRATYQCECGRNCPECSMYPCQCTRCSCCREVVIKRSGIGPNPHGLLWSDCECTRNLTVGRNPQEINP